MKRKKKEIDKNTAYEEEKVILPLFSMEMAYGSRFVDLGKLIPHGVPW
jgi:hypothetical protein